MLNPAKLSSVYLLQQRMQQTECTQRTVCKPSQQQKQPVALQATVFFLQQALEQTAPWGAAARHQLQMPSMVLPQTQPPSWRTVALVMRQLQRTPK